MLVQKHTVKWTQQCFLEVSIDNIIEKSRRKICSFLGLPFLADIDLIIIYVAGIVSPAYGRTVQLRFEPTTCGVYDIALAHRTIRPRKRNIFHYPYNRGLKRQNLARAELYGKWIATERHNNLCIHVFLAQIIV